ncbi:hypothetical protein ABTN08_20340, partial [Acinetobacter baumannii]
SAKVDCFGQFGALESMVERREMLVCALGYGEKCRAGVRQLVHAAGGDFAADPVGRGCPADFGGALPAWPVSPRTKRHA